MNRNKALAWSVLLLGMALCTPGAWPHADPQGLALVLLASDPVDAHAASGHRLRR